MTETITALLQRWQSGDETVLERLTPKIYEELHRIARSLMSRESDQHTLQPTALLNEAFIRLSGAQIDLQNKQHFFRVSARQMRRVLVDHARSKHRNKRQAVFDTVTLDELAGDQEDVVDLVDLDKVLNELGEYMPRTLEMIELNHFAGLTHVETGQALGISSKTVQRELRFAHAWIKQRLSP